MPLLIAIEGIDGSGKGTQAALLREALTTAGHRTELLSFPRYEHTSFGRRIGEFLNGRYGRLDQVHPVLASLLYAGDRFESKPVLLDALTQHDVVILDRYVASNIAHQAAKCAGEERRELIDWIRQVEFELYGLPRPDLVLLLDLPTDRAAELIARKRPRTYTDRAADLHEADTAYLERVREVYRDLAAEGASRWKLVSVLAGNGALRSIEDVAAEIRALVLAVLTDESGT